MEGFGVGRGRGISTNVPERALIEQVKIRPLLYDKTVKDYRKVSCTLIIANLSLNLLDSNSLESQMQPGMRSLKQ